MALLESIRAAEAQATAAKTAAAEEATRRIEAAEAQAEAQAKRIFADAETKAAALLQRATSEAQAAREKEAVAWQRENETMQAAARARLQDVVEQLMSEVERA